MLATTPDDAASVFAALGDPTRLALVARLSARGPLSIARLAAGSTVSRQAVTKHLHVLAAADLAHSARLGRELIWQLDTARLRQARQAIDQISTQWDQALDKLRHYVEEDT
ncbi:MAG TPA: metalloregulator ArsR/SmtB family transcription factor [Chloroflexota bacterium]